MSFVDGLSLALARRTSRRGFLTRTALVGSALSVAPVSYALRPGSAYAAICNCSGSNCDCGATCCDGYTAFCCELNGVNACPPGTLMAGWWKVDSSNFCTVDGVPQPRYYMDCNLTCPDGCGCGPGGICGSACSGASCGCNLGCDHRKSDCVRFRYGNCQQQLACVGPIRCRVVTCTPPWLLEPTCTTTARVDEGTRFHHAPCLELDAGNPDGRVVSVSLAPGGIRVVGYTTTPGATVHISAGPVVLGAVTADLEFTDVAQPAVFGAYWFMGEFAVVGGTHGVCATLVDGIRTSVLGCRTISVPLGSPIGSLDVAAALPDGKVRVIGWTIDPDTVDPVEVHVYGGGRFLGSGVADRPRFDIGLGYPAFGFEHGFDLTLDLPPGIRDVCVFAVNGAGAGTNPALGCRAVVPPTGPVRGSWDVVEALPGAVRVAGWAVDPDATRPVAIHVYVGGSFAGAGLADGARPDIGALFPGYGDQHGFDIVIPVEAGLGREICVYAVDQAGGQVSPRLGCRVVSVPTGSPRGSLDLLAVGPAVIRVAGWAADIDDLGRPVTISVRIDGAEVATTPASLTRPDLPALLGPGRTDHGFDLELPVASGSRQLQVVARNLGPNGADVVLRTTTIAVPLAALDPSSELSG